MKKPILNQILATIKMAVNRIPFLQIVITVVSTFMLLFSLIYSISLFTEAFRLETVSEFNVFKGLRAFGMISVFCMIVSTFAIFVSLLFKRGDFHNLKPLNSKTGVLYFTANLLKGTIIAIIIVSGFLLITLMGPAKLDWKITLKVILNMDTILMVIMAIFAGFIGIKTEFQGDKYYVPAPRKERKPKRGLYWSIILIIAGTLAVNAQSQLDSLEESVYMENMLLKNPVYDKELSLPDLVKGPFQEEFKIEDQRVGAQYIQLNTVAGKRRRKNTFQMIIFSKESRPIEKKFTFKQLEKPFHKGKNFLDKEIGEGFKIQHLEGDNPYFKGELFTILGKGFRIEYHIGNLLLNTLSSLEGYSVPEKYIYSEFYSNGCTISRIKP